MFYKVSGSFINFTKSDSIRHCVPMTFSHETKRYKAYKDRAGKITLFDKITNKERGTATNEYRFSKIEEVYENPYASCKQEPITVELYGGDFKLTKRTYEFYLDAEKHKKCVVRNDYYREDCSNDAVPTFTSYNLKGETTEFDSLEYVLRRKDNEHIHTYQY